MSKKDEALKLALEAFEADASNENFLVLKHCVREAMAEQPAQHSASVLEQNTSNSLETTNQQAQDEPVAWMTHSNDLLLFHRTRAEALNWQTQPTPLYTSPQPSKPWVGLDETDLAVCDTDGVRLARYWERVLREKNNGTR